MRNVRPVHNKKKRASSFAVKVRLLHTTYFTNAINEIKQITDLSVEILEADSVSRILIDSDSERKFLSTAELIKILKLHET